MPAGFILPSDRRPGETCTGILVSNPEDYAGIPGLTVVNMEIPEHLKNGRAELAGMVVDTNRQKRQRADGPIVFDNPAGAAEGPVSVEVAISDRPNEKTRQVLARLSDSQNLLKRSSPARFTIAPIMPDTGVSVVHGPFSGAGTATRVIVNDTPAEIVAENPGEVFFQPANDMTEGGNPVRVIEGEREESFYVYLPELQIDADKTALHKGESTAFRVKLSGLQDLPAGAWASGLPSELYDLGEVAKLAPDFTPPASSEEGVILLVIKNDSSATADIEPARGNVITREIHRADLLNGSFIYEGTISAKASGPFKIEAFIRPFLAEAVSTGTTKISATR
ncbi:MAG TPA: hypothetical protein VIX12_06940 [Candidatus Binataceae bacterium]